MSHRHWVYANEVFVFSFCPLLVQHRHTQHPRCGSTVFPHHPFMCPNSQTASQEKPLWPHHSCAAKVLCNPRLQTEAVAITNLLSRVVFSSHYYVLVVFSVRVFESAHLGLCFILQQDFLFCHVVSIVYPPLMISLFPSHWNVPGCRRCKSASKLWLVIRVDGASVCPAPLHAWSNLMTHFPLALPG